MAASDKISAGELFLPSARLHNRFVDAADHVLGSRFNHGQLGGSSPLQVAIENTGVDREEFEILEISGVSITHADNADDFKSSWALKGKVPTGPGAPFVITRDPIESNAIGRCTLVGASPVQIDVGDANHTFAYPTTDATKLKSSTGGPAQILYKESGTGTKWALVFFPSLLNIWRFTLNENMGATTANEASADLVDLDGTDTTIDITVLDPTVAFDDLVNTDPGLCLQIGAKYYVIQAPC